MTKRDFDALTKRNMGNGLARDERCNYRTERMRETWGERRDGTGSLALGLHRGARLRDGAP